MPRQLRQSSMSRGLGVTELVKAAAPGAGANFTRAVPGDYWERCLALTFQLVTSAAAGTRLPVINYMDGDGFVFNQVPLSGGIGPGLTVTTYADLATVTPVQQPVSQQTEGSVTSPAAGATIASLTLPAGDWQLAWQVMVDINGAVADDDNFGLFSGAVQLVGSESGHAPGVPYPQEPVEVSLGAAGGTVAVKAIALGTVTAVYVAQLAAVPLSQAGLQATMPDFLMRSGWQLGVTVAGIQAGDQISAVALLLERFPSDTAAGRPRIDVWELIEDAMRRQAG